MTVAFARAQTTELILAKLTANMYSILDRWYVNLHMGVSNCFEIFFKLILLFNNLFIVLIKMA